MVRLTRINGLFGVIGFAPGLLIGVGVISLLLLARGNDTVLLETVMLSGITIAAIGGVTKIGSP